MARLVDTTTLFLFLIAAVLGATGVVLYFQLQTDEVSTYLDENDTLRILFVVHEDNQPRLSSLLFLHPDNGRVAILDIPRNLGTVIPGEERIDGIGTLFDADDPMPYRTSVEHFVAQEVGFHLVFSVEELQAFIDLVGGIQVFVISDYAATNEPMLLPSGNVVLDGTKALAYLLEATEGLTVLERVGRNHAFVQAFFRSVQSEVRFLSHRDTVPYRQELIGGGLDKRAMDGFLGVVSATDFDQLIARQIQGNLRSVDVAGETKQLLFPHFEGQWLQQSVRQVEEALTAAEEVSDQAALIEIEVLNGTSINGFARRTSQLFEEYGFEVRRFGNADSNQVEHTLVIDRRGYASYADRVAGVIQAPRVVTEVVPGSDVDVTVILGGDFDGTVVRE